VLATDSRPLHDRSSDIQRWLLTEKSYEQQNPKRLYYLSMEFLVGRSLQNNVTNLLLVPLADHLKACPVAEA
jgi:glucan phosphorylase